MTITPSPQNFLEIMGNSRLYRVPPFQRDYSWTEDALEDLWEDLTEVRQEKGSHYLGHIVLQKKDESEFIIIDGQQRLASLSILVLAIIAVLRERGFDGHADALHETFIVSKDIVTLEKNNKLQLNLNDGSFYRMICRGEELPVRKLTASTRKLKKAFTFFRDKVKKLTDEELSVDPRVLLPGFVGIIGKNLEFTVINVNDEQAAFRVFETLNARGVQLSVPDLLKNFLFAKYFRDEEDPNKGEYDEIQEKWGFINAQLGDKNFADFLIAEWNSRHRLVRRNKLFREIRKEVNTHESASEYLGILRRQCTVYPALLDGGDEFWQELHNTNISKNLNALALYNIKQPHALFLAAWTQWREKNEVSKFDKLVDWVTNFSIRYNVIGRRSPSEQERLYNSLCELVRTGNSLPQIKEKLLSLYPADAVFIGDFAKFSFSASTPKRPRYILSKLEGEMSGAPCDPSVLTLEHILPQNPGENWIEYFGNDWEDHVNRLGNITLVERKKNLGQEPYAEKKDALGKYSYALNRQLEQWECWDKDAIEARQKNMAEIACRCWRID